MPLWIKDRPEVKGPFIVWQYYGPEGWKPTSYQSLKEAIEADKYANYIITRPVVIAPV